MVVDDSKIIKNKDQTYHEHIRFCLVNRAGNQVINKLRKSLQICTNLICFTMVLFPDSPAPVTEGKTLRFTLTQSRYNSHKSAMSSMPANQPYS